MAEINLWALIVVKLSELGILKRYINIQKDTRSTQAEYLIYLTEGVITVCTGMYVRIMYIMSLPDYCILYCCTRTV